MDEYKRVIKDIAAKKHNKYSQFGEDGILEAIFERIGIENKWCAEVGASDGIIFSNTRQWVERGWSAVLIECDKDRFEQLLKNATPNCRCENIKIEPAGPNSLDVILAKHSVPVDMDLLVIDVDGQDWHIWNSLLNYRPRVVVIEHAFLYDSPQDAEPVPPIGGKGQAGRKAIEALAVAKYCLPVASTETNTICLRKDLFEKLFRATEQREILRLNLGAGDVPLDGYVPIDRKAGKEVYPLDYPDNSVDEIRASHILEHFGHKDIYNILAHWTAKLKPGGVLKIAVPDFKIIADKYLKKEQINVAGYLFGGQVDENDFHKTVFDEDSLIQLMGAVGLKNICHWTSEISDCASLPISLNLAGTKPGEWKEPQKFKPLKIAAVMSMPRLGFTDNFFTAYRSLLPLGITLDKGTGVFWGQILTRMMEKYLHDGTEYIITIDYDSWFTKSHVVRLCQLMQENPGADAIVPLQLHREQDCPLFGAVDTKTDPATGRHYIEPENYKKPLVEIATGHFGLTIFRVSSLKKLSKPWFLPVPDPAGGWNDGRTDEDIFFWNNFRKAGLKPYIAMDIYIGHLQLMCTFCGLPEDNWNAIHFYMNNLEKNGPPAHCVPKVELLK